MKVRPYGEEALLVDLADLDTVLGLYAALRVEPLSGVEEVVPAARTVLLRLTPGADPAAVGRAVTSVGLRPPDAMDEDPVAITVVYDGPDLDAVAELTGLTRDEVVAAHTGTDLRVGFAGFAPGFGYLVGLPEVLHVPRRADPRTEVPAGAVGLAGEFTGVYPRSSPGGWQLIGRTAAVLWDLDRDPPALLRPGVRVRFVAA